MKFSTQLTLVELDSAELLAIEGGIVEGGCILLPFPIRFPLPIRVPLPIIDPIGPISLS